MLYKKYHGDDLNRVQLNSSDCFVLELIIQNLNSNPMVVKQFIKELSLRLKDKQVVNKRRSDKVADMEDGLKRKGYFAENIQLTNSKASCPTYTYAVGIPTNTNTNGSMKTDI